MELSQTISDKDGAPRNARTITGRTRDSTVVEGGDGLIAERRYRHDFFAKLLDLRSHSRGEIILLLQHLQDR